MLNEKAYLNPVPGVWETFETQRERLNLQIVNPCFVDGSGLTPEALKEGFNDLRQKLSNESPVIRKAKLFEYILINGRISVDPDDWFADKLDHQGLMSEYNRHAMNDTPATYAPTAMETIQTAASTGYYSTGLDTGHVSPGWRYMYSKGLSGLLTEAHDARAVFGNKLTNQQEDFYTSLEIVYKAIIKFTRRLSDMAASKVGIHSDAADARLLTIADSLKNVPCNPPRDFHEALQFAYIMHQMIEMEGQWVRSMGGFDRCYFTYYDNDIKVGKLTVKNTQEMIKFFFTKFYATTRGASNGKNFYFGGQNCDGTNAENELTYVALEAYREMNTTDPKLSVRVYQNTTEILLRQVAETIRAGCTAFVLVNDEIAIPAIMTQDKTLEEAREYLLIGCYEPAIEGKEIACNMSISLNLAKGIELVFNRGVDLETGKKLGPDTGDPNKFKSYDEFEKAYFTQLGAQIESATDAVKQYELLWPIMNPSPVLAGTFEDALKSGRDIGQSGPKYNNTGCMGAGIANAVDSLAAIKKAVFEDKVYTMASLSEAVLSNFKSDEKKKMRLYLSHRIPKWGNADSYADTIAKRVVDFYSQSVNRIDNSRGGKFVPSMFSLDHRYSLGKKMSALPDGRGKAEPLSLNNAANYGKDKEGVTALINSMTCLDYIKLPNGSVTDVYLHPSAIKGENGQSALISLIKTYFERGGFGIQFNIFDKQTLLDAQKNPEKYRNLQIRVSGWNVYFVTLSAYEQEQYINSTIHAM
jgi:formate C-acetyltransferase